ncbi:hypothetical protein ABPG74_009711 [Tetrahymena malaccensis]
MLAKEDSWIPFHVVACNSEEHGTQADLLSVQSHQSQRSWESSRTGSFPVELVLRFHYRSELHHILLCCKPDKGIPVVEFYIGDGLNGGFLDAEYRLAGKADFIQNLPKQIKLMGIGNYLKIRIPKPSGRNPQNPFGQVSLSILKVWGRYTNYMSKIKNEELQLVDDKTNIDKILIGMGIPVDMINWFDQDARMYEHAPIDEDTRITLNDMIKIKDLAVKQEDYEGLKSLAEDIKIVFEIGKEIWSIKREINFCIAKEDFPRAIELKKRLKQLEGKRDGYDALYETSRYENMIVLERPTTADYNKIIGALDDDERRRADERRRQRELEEAERQRLLDELRRQQELLNQQNTQQSEPEPPREPTIEDKGPAWWEKSTAQDIKILKKKKVKKEKKEEVIDVNFKNPLAFNEGDIDLEMYLKPLLANAGEKVPDISSEILRRLYHLGYLQVFGSKCWCAIYSENWRHREAAAQAVLNFIEMPLPEKYLNGNSKKLFGACMEMAKIACEDKILQIYFIGLKILSTALAPPVCGTDVSPKMINQVLKEFTPMLIEKISELNFRSRDISLHTLLSIYRHPVAEVGQLINSCLEICIENPNFSSLYVPPQKQPHRIMMARLEIILNVLQESGYDERQWNWLDVFNFMLSPCLFHPSNEIRMVAIEIIVALYQLIGQDVRDAVDLIENLKPNLVQMIYERLDSVKEIADQNQAKRENILSLVKEMDPRLEQTPQGSYRPGSDGFNEFINGQENQQQASQFVNNQNQSNVQQKPPVEQKPLYPSVALFVDGINNIQENKFAHTVFVTQMPGGNFYTTKKLDSFNKVYSNLNWDGYLNSPHFKPEHYIAKENLTQKSYFILEVKQINTSKPQAVFKTIGWTAIPMYEGDKKVVSGSFQVPLFQGEVSAQILQEMVNRAPWDVFAEKISEKKNPLKYQEFVSILLRIDSSENLAVMGNQYSLDKLDQRYLPPNKFKKWVLDAELDGKLQKEKKKLNSIVPSKQDPLQYNQLINEQINAAFK